MCTLKSSYFLSFFQFIFCLSNPVVPASGGIGTTDHAILSFATLQCPCGNPLVSACANVVLGMGMGPAPFEFSPVL